MELGVLLVNGIRSRQSSGGISQGKKNVKFKDSNIQSTQKISKQFQQFEPCQNSVKLCHNMSERNQTKNKRP